MSDKKQMKVGVTFTHTVDYTGSGTGAIGEAASNFWEWFNKGREEGSLKLGKDFEYTIWEEV